MFPLIEEIVQIAFLGCFRFRTNSRSLRHLLWVRVCKREHLGSNVESTKVFGKPGRFGEPSNSTSLFPRFCQLSTFRLVRASISQRQISIISGKEVKQQNTHAKQNEVTVFMRRTKILTVSQSFLDEHAFLMKWITVTSPDHGCVRSWNFCRTAGIGHFHEIAPGCAAPYLRQPWLERSCKEVDSTALPLLSCTVKTDFFKLAKMNL